MSKGEAFLVASSVLNMSLRSGDEEVEASFGDLPPLSPWSVLGTTLFIGISLA